MSPEECVTDGPEGTLEDYNAIKDLKKKKSTLPSSQGAGESHTGRLI